jgi:hypothetical protein
MQPEGSSAKRRQRRRPRGLVTLVAMSVQDTLPRRQYLLGLRSVALSDEGLVSCRPRALQLHRRHRCTRRGLVTLVARSVQDTLPRRQHGVDQRGVEACAEGQLSSRPRPLQIFRPSANNGAGLEGYTLFAMSVQTRCRAVNTTWLERRRFTRRGPPFMPPQGLISPCADIGVCSEGW